MSTRRQVEPTYWEKLKLEEGWFSFFALLLAFMTVVWSIEGAHWADGSDMLPRAALVGFLVGFGLAKVRFIPGLLAHSFMVSVGMVFVGLLVAPFADKNYDDWSRKLGSTVLRVVKWFEAALAGNAHDDSLVYLVLLSFGVWLLGYTIAWTLFRGHKIWWTLLLLGAALMVNLSFNPPNAIYSFTFFLIVSLLLVVRFSAFMDEQRWRSLRLYFQPGLWRRAMVVGGCLVLVILAVAFATPSSSQIESFGQVLTKVTEPFSGVKGFWDGLGSGTGDGNEKVARSRSNYNNLDDSFTIGGPLRLSNEPVFRVTSDGSTPPIYLQAKAMDEYDGKGWINTYQTTEDPQSDKALFRRLSLAANQSLPTSTDRGRGTTTLTVTSLVAGFNPILTMGDLVGSDHPSLVAFHYNKVLIDTSLDSFKLKDISDGNGGKRSVLVDDSTGKVVPPAMLDLIKYLKEGSRLTDLSFPSNLTFTYVRNGNYTYGEYRLGNDKPVKVGHDQNGFYTLQLGQWIYKLPPVQDLQNLALQPGGTAVTNRVARIAVTSKSAPDKPVDIVNTVYLSSGGDFSLTIESPQSRGTIARDKFEATPTGQKVLAEIKKLEGAVKGNKITYILTNGLPSGLRYEGYEPNYDDLTGAILPQPLNPGQSYTSTARRYVADIESLRKAPADYPDWVKSRYLSLPKNFSPGIRALALDLAGNAPTAYDKTMALVNYLNSLNYNVNPPAPPEGRDEIDFFLFDSKSGYCVHFSSSLALMLRSLGIPTRVVTGYIGGEFDPASNSWIVKGSAAHAWTQVYFTGLGWVDFEPTPGREGIQRPADPSAVPPSPVATQPPAAVAPVTTPASDASSDPEIPKKTPNDPEQNNPATPTPGIYTEPPKEFPVWLLWAAAIILSGVAVFGTRKLYLKHQFALPDTSPLAVYNRMSLAARKSGLRGRSGMTPNEYAGYLTQQLPEAAGPVEAITRAYVRRRYGPPPDLDEERHKQHLAAAQAADQKLREAEANGQEPSREDLWTAFKTHSDVSLDERQVREAWESYMEAVLNFRRQRRIDKVTPDFVRNLRANYRPGPNHKN
jgi:transglutaminase-like putative cysteine protease